ncbi:hypothetical protein ACGF0D_10850 [Kitasatospora sp. NPDC048298]|uniref:hypothetical protein n=1 Tax=Kitasatospora sp. NPDC048298 TaxID=3364049 RepID=UPI00371C979A
MDPTDADAGIPVYETIDPQRLEAIEASFAELGAHAHGRPLQKSTRSAAAEPEAER